MFESNFPPDKESCSYRTLYNAFKRMAAALELTAEEKADWWPDAVEVWPPYDDYQAKTDRDIPVVILDPRD